MFPRSLTESWTTESVSSLGRTKGNTEPCVEGPWRLYMHVATGYPTSRGRAGLSPAETRLPSVKSSLTEKKKPLSFDITSPACASGSTLRASRHSSSVHEGGASSDGRTQCCQGTESRQQLHFPRNWQTKLVVYRCNLRGDGAETDLNLISFSARQEDTLISKTSWE